MRQNFKDAKAWADCGMKITFASDEVCKLYDAALSQLISWGYETGLGEASDVNGKLGKAGDEIVLVQALFLGLKLLGGKTVHADKATKEAVDKFLELVDKQRTELTPWELRHAAAVKYISEGDMDAAILEWENITIDYPTDIHAVFTLFLALFAVGASKSMMDFSCRVSPYFTQDVPLQEYIMGIKAFAMEEAGYYKQAEKVAMANIQDFPHDTFAYHAMAHIFEMERRLGEGKVLIEKTVKQWERGTALACHLTWHNSLFYFENCEFDEAVEIYDTRLKKYLTPDNFLAYSDAASLFYRLHMAGYDVGKERWRELCSVTDHFMEDTVRPFHASHILMASLCNNDQERANQTIANVKKYMQPTNGYYSSYGNEVGDAIMNGMVKFHEQSYDEATDILRPVRQHIYRIGGSHAQRDVYEQLICHSALKSQSKHNQNFARQLLAERQVRLGGPLTDMMAAQLMASHYANE